MGHIRLSEDAAVSSAGAVGGLGVHFQIAFEIEGDYLVVHKVTPGQDDHLQGLSEILSEWISPEDEKAWRGL